MFKEGGVDGCPLADPTETPQMDGNIGSKIGQNGKPTTYHTTAVDHPSVAKSSEAYQAFRSQRYGEAATLYKEALVLLGPHAGLYADLAAALFNSNDFYGALDAASRCLYFDRDHPMGLTFYAEASARLAEDGGGLHLYVDAIAKYKAAIARLPEHDGLFRRLEKVEQVLAQKLPSEEARGHFARGVTHMRNDRLKEAAESIKEAGREWDFLDPAVAHLVRFPFAFPSAKLRGLVLTARPCSGEKHGVLAVLRSKAGGGQVG